MGCLHTTGEALTADDCVHAFKDRCMQQVGEVVCENGYGLRHPVVTNPFLRIHIVRFPLCKVSVGGVNRRCSNGDSRFRLT